VDLRKTLASSILVVGGTPMIPGFIPRLHTEIIRALSTPSSSTSRQPGRPGRVPRPSFDRYATLKPLKSHFAILNNPNPIPQPSGMAPTTPTRGSQNAGRAPAFTPAAMAWVGGSLAGYVIPRSSHSFVLSDIRKTEL
jgi:actin-related protein 10